MRPKSGSALEHAHREMKELFGFVPQFYQAVPESGRAAAWSMQRDLQLSETALDQRTKELIGLAIASHIKCRYGIHFHTEAARAFGASDAELREAAAMGGMTVSFSNAMTGAQLDFDRFRREADRAIRMMSDAGGKAVLRAKRKARPASRPSPAAKTTRATKSTHPAKSTPAARSTPAAKSTRAAKSTPAAKSTRAAKSIHVARSSGVSNGRSSARRS